MGKIEHSIIIMTEKSIASFLIALELGNPNFGVKIFCQIKTRLVIFSTLVDYVDLVDYNLQHDKKML